MHCTNNCDTIKHFHIQIKKGEKTIMKKQTKIAAVLSAAAFMAMVSGLPVYAASHG